MSYDLDFLRRPAQSVRFDDVVGWAGGRPLLKRIDENTIIYDNPDTGVHFNLEAGTYAAGESPEYPAGCEYAGFSFNLNLHRPSFFAYEAMPVVIELARALGLTIFDLQRGAAAADGPALIDGWQASNKLAAVAAAELDSRVVMRHDKAMAFWRYQRDRARLTAELAPEDIFVPTLFLFRAAGTREVTTALTWTADVHMLVPPSDWAVVVRPRKSWLVRDKQQVGYLSTQELMEKIAPYLRPFRDTGWQVLDRENAGAVARVLNTLDLKLGLSRFQRVTADEFTDISDL